MGEGREEIRINEKKERDKRKKGKRTEKVKRQKGRAKRVASGN